MVIQLRHLIQRRASPVTLVHIPITCWHTRRLILHHSDRPVLTHRDIVIIQVLVEVGAWRQQLRIFAWGLLKLDMLLFFVEGGKVFVFGIDVAVGLLDFDFVALV